MSSALVQFNATVICVHAGQAQPSVGATRVKLGGPKAVLQSDLYSITGCTLPPPPNGNGPCLTATWSTAATRVKAGGVPLLLMDSQASCLPTGTGLSVVATQTRVRGI
jgi:hypothetical protein